MIQTLGFIFSRSFVEFCDITVTANVALLRTAYQSSLYSNYYASRAVDGDTSCCFRESCTSEWIQKDPWWAVDLVAPMDVARVCVVNDLNPGHG